MTPASELAEKAIPAGATAAVIPALTELPFDVWWILFLPLGLLLGWSARAGKMLGERKTWSEIRHDFWVSLLIGGANALLAAVIIAQFDLEYLQGVAVAFICAFGGVQSLQAAVDWTRNHVIDDAASAGRRREEAHKQSLENRDRDLERIARKIGEQKDDDPG